MSCTKLGFLLMVILIIYQYNYIVMGQENWVLDQERLDPLGLQSKTSVLDQKDQGGLQLFGEQLRRTK